MFKLLRSINNKYYFNKMNYILVNRAIFKKMYLKQIIIIMQIENSRVTSNFLL